MLQFLRTTSLIPVLEGLRQNWVSPYQPIRSVFKADRSYSILSTLPEKFILHLLLARPQLKLHHTPGPRLPRSTWNQDHKVCSKPYQARARQHTTAARALGWHSFLSWPAWSWGKIPQPAEKCCGKTQTAWGAAEYEPTVWGGHISLHTDSSPLRPCSTRGLSCHMRSHHNPAPAQVTDNCPLLTTWNIFFLLHCLAS